MKNLKSVINNQTFLTYCVALILWMVAPHLFGTQPLHRPLLAPDIFTTTNISEMKFESIHCQVNEFTNNHM